MTARKAFTAGSPASKMNGGRLLDGCPPTASVANSRLSYDQDCTVSETRMTTLCLWGRPNLALKGVEFIEIATKCMIPQGQLVEINPRVLLVHGQPTQKEIIGLSQ